MRVSKTSTVHVPAMVMRENFLGQVQLSRLNWNPPYRCFESGGNGNDVTIAENTI